MSAPPGQKQMTEGQHHPQPRRDQPSPPAIMRSHGLPPPPAPPNVTQVTYLPHYQTAAFQQPGSHHQEHPGRASSLQQPPSVSHVPLTQILHQPHPLPPTHHQQPPPGQQLRPPMERMPPPPVILTARSQTPTFYHSRHGHAEYSTAVTHPSQQPAQHQRQFAYQQHQGRQPVRQRQFHQDDGHLRRQEVSQYGDQQVRHLPHAHHAHVPPVHQGHPGLQSQAQHHQLQPTYQAFAVTPHYPPEPLKREHQAAASPRYYAGQRVSSMSQGQPVLQHASNTIAHQAVSGGLPQSQLGQPHSLDYEHGHEQSLPRGSASATSSGLASSVLNSPTAHEHRRRSSVSVLTASRPTHSLQEPSGAVHAESKPMSTEVVGARSSVPLRVGAPTGPLAGPPTGPPAGPSAGPPAPLPARVPSPLPPSSSHAQNMTAAAPTMSRQQGRSEASRAASSVREGAQEESAPGPNVSHANRELGGTPNGTGPLSSGAVSESNVGQQPQGGVPATSGAEGEGPRQLRVEDALAYLEQVKNHYGDQPQIYNNFLDIMKEFKAQTIDTTQVIRRVSHLFKDNKHLILGFNTFLPPGYHIELRNDPETGSNLVGYVASGATFSTLQPPEDPRSGGSGGRREEPPRQTGQAEHQGGQQRPNDLLESNVEADQQHPQAAHRQPVVAVRRTHPFAASMQQEPPGSQIQRSHQPYESQRVVVRQTGAPLPHQQLLQESQGRHPSEPEMQQRTQEGHMTRVQASHVYAVRPEEQPRTGGNVNAAAALARGFSPGESAVTPSHPSVPVAPVADSQAPVAARPEFEKAVSYVNRIKDRFKDNEQVYKDFLDVLQTYQRELKSIHEVCAQVKELFKGHPDLMQEFRHFLPEHPVPPGYSHRARPEYPSREQGAQAHQGHHQQVADQGMYQYDTRGPVSSIPSASAYYAKTEYSVDTKPQIGVAEKSNAAPSAVAGVPKPQPKPAGSHGKGKIAVSVARKSGSTDSKRRRPVPIPKTEATLSQDYKPSAQHSFSVPAGPELEFFHALRQTLEPHGVQYYDEFMKCVSLFAQEIISREEFLRMADDLLSLHAYRTQLIGALRTFLNHNNPSSAANAVEELRQIRDRELEAMRSGMISPASRGTTKSKAGEHPRSPRMSARSPKLNPAYRGRSLRDVARRHGKPLADSKSYMTIPDDYGGLHASGMTSGDKEVLNHAVVNCTRFNRNLSNNKRSGTSHGVKRSASHDGDADDEHMESQLSKKQRVDDQRCSLDVSIASTENTLKKLRPYVNGSASGPLHLKPIDLQPIEMIYANAGIDIADVLRNNPTASAKIVYDRLKQRVEAWKKEKGNLEKIWRSARFRNVENPGDAPRGWSRSELLNDVDIPRKVTICKLFKDNANQNLVMELFWYVLEWETESEGRAQEASGLFRKLFESLGQTSMAFYGDKNLYLLARLAAAVTESANYVLLHNYEGKAFPEYVEALKSLLAGRKTILEYEADCIRLYGRGRRWETLLMEFPVVVGRLVRACLRLTQRAKSIKLLEVYQKFSAKDEAEAAKEYRRAALDIARGEDKFLVEIEGKLMKKQLAAKYRLIEDQNSEGGTDEDGDVKMKDQPNGTKQLDGGENEKGEEVREKSSIRGVSINSEWMELSIQRVASSEMTHFVPLDLEKTEGKTSKFISYVNKQARNSKYKKRDAVIFDGLKPRLETGTKRVLFVPGTESYLRRKDFGIGKKHSPAKSKNVERFRKWHQAKVFENRMFVSMP